jgi:hypothetical protein
VQPFLFHKATVIWAEIAVQHILMLIMPPQSLPVKPAGVPPGALLPIRLTFPTIESILVERATFPEARSRGRQSAPK